MYRRLIAVSLFTLSLSGSALAATPMVDSLKTELKDAKSTLKNDSKDAKSLQKIVDGWHKAWQAQKHEAEAKWDAKLMDWIDAELAENKEQRRAGRADIESTEGPRMAERKEQELETEKLRIERVRNLAVELRTLQTEKFTPHKAGPPAHEQKSKLLKELLHAAERDVKVGEKDVDACKERLAKAKAHA